MLEVVKYTRLESEKANYEHMVRKSGT